MSWFIASLLWNDHFITWKCSRKIANLSRFNVKLSRYFMMPSRDLVKLSHFFVKLQLQVDLGLIWCDHFHQACFPHQHAAKTFADFFFFLTQFSVSIVSISAMSILFASHAASHKPQCVCISPPLKVHIFRQCKIDDNYPENVSKWAQTDFSGVFVLVRVQITIAGKQSDRHPN